MSLRQLPRLAVSRSFQIRFSHYYGPSGQAQRAGTQRETTNVEALKEFKINYWWELLNHTGDNGPKPQKSRAPIAKISIESMQRAGRENPVRRRLRESWGD
jgi:hypothetical protein